jgi:polyhydroxyalkanoate synthesis regulator phasin
MAQNDVFKRYLDAALEFSALTQSRAEALVKDLVKAGEVQADQARDTVSELLERSRKNSEKLIETVRTEVKGQISSLGLASKEDIDKLEKRLSSLVEAATGPVRKAAAKATPAKKPAAKKPVAKKAPAKKAPAKKAPAKKQA